MQINTESKATRDTFKVQLRKQKNEEAFSCKRFFRPKTSGESSSTASILSQRHSETSLDQKSREEIVAAYENLINEVNSSKRDWEKVTVLLGNLRKTVSNQQVSSLQVVFEMKLYDAAMTFLEKSYEALPELQKECLWLLSNLTAVESKYTKALVDLGIIQKTLSFLSSSSDEVHELALWILCNLIGDKETDHREIIIHEGGISFLIERLKTIQTQPPQPLLKAIAWFVASVTRAPYLNLEIFTDIIHILHVTIQSSDYETKLESAWAANHIFHSIKPEQVRSAIRSPQIRGIIQKCIQMIYSHQKEIVIPSIRGLSRLVAISQDDQTQEMMALGLTNALVICMGSAETIIRKEAVFVLANICCGLPSQIEEVSRNPDFYGKIKNCLATDHIDVKNECVHVLLNISAWKFYPLTQEMVNNCAIELLLATIDTLHNDHEIVINSLNALKNILRVGESNVNQIETENPYRAICESNGVDQVFLRLQKHPNPDIYNLAVEIIEDFFDSVPT